MNDTRNLCAQIPISLHEKVRQEQEQMGIRLNEYVERIFTEHFERGRTMADTRTMAIQIPEELFQRLKEHLAKEHISQKQFIIGLIEKALEEAERPEKTEE